jgi:hypothetical protein
MSSICYTMRMYPLKELISFMQIFLLIFLVVEIIYRVITIYTVIIRAASFGVRFQFSSSSVHLIRLFY